MLIERVYKAEKHDTCLKLEVGGAVIYSVHRCGGSEARVGWEYAHLLLIKERKHKSSLSDRKSVSITPSHNTVSSLSVDDTRKTATIHQTRPL